MVSINQGWHLFSYNVAACNVKRSNYLYLPCIMFSISLCFYLPRTQPYMANSTLAIARVITNCPLCGFRQRIDRLTGLEFQVTDMEHDLLPLEAKLVYADKGRRGLRSVKQPVIDQQQPWVERLNSCLLGNDGGRKRMGEMRLASYSGSWR